MGSGVIESKPWGRGLTRPGKLIPWVGSLAGARLIARSRSLPPGGLRREIYNLGTVSGPVLFNIKGKCRIFMKT